MRGFSGAMAVVACALALGACKTTEEAARNVRGKWIGQRADAFFIENGPPVSSFELDGGGTIYTWRGGETSYVRPARVTTQPAFGSNNFSTRSRTTSATFETGPGSTVTRSRTTTTSFGYSPQAVLVQPAERVELVCEAQIATDTNGIITSVRINRDTEGAFLSLSRCADLFATE